MQPYALVVDDFLDDPDSLRKFADTAPYKTTVNPFDHHEYPGICLLNRPEEIKAKLELILNTAVEVRSLFLRQSLKDAAVPEQAHADVAMGCHFSMILYLNRPKHCRGGTSLLRHVGSGAEDAYQEGWLQDQNDPKQWETVMHVPMKFNRAFIYPSRLLHRSDPIGGFGDNSKNGRLVAVALIDTV